MSKMNLKVCHLAKYYPPAPGGFETHIQTLARAQAKLGAEVRVICINSMNHLGNLSQITSTISENDESVKVIRLGRLLTFARFDICPSFIKYLWAVLKDGYDIVHLHTPNPTMLIAWLVTKLIALVAKLPQPVLVITHHSDIVKQRFLKYLLRPLEYLVYQQAASILVTSSQYIEGSKFLAAFHSRLKVLPLGLDCSGYLNPPATAELYACYLKAKYGEPLWLCVGRLVYYKALHLAIEALKSAPGTLLIIGTGSLEGELKEKAKRLGLENRIVWLGNVDEDQLIGAYHAATALWFPSNARSEGFGLVQVEAMASGCPPINAKIFGSGVPWVSRHEQEGLTIPLDSAVALAEAAKRIIREPGLRDRLVVASRERAIKEFDYIKMTKRSFEIYVQALKSKSIFPVSSSAIPVKQYRK